MILLKLFKLAHLNLPTQPHLCLPMETIIKALAHSSPALCLVMDPGAVRVCVWRPVVCTPFLGIGMYNKLSFQWQLFPDLLALPNLNNHCIY